MKFKKASISGLLKTKGDPVRKLQEALSKKYTFEPSSAYNVVPKGKRVPSEYHVYARVEDLKKQSRSGEPVRIIAGRKVPTQFPGRKVSTVELNKVLRELKNDSTLQFIRSSYDTTHTNPKFRNYFKFRFSLRSK